MDLQQCNALFSISNTETKIWNFHTSFDQLIHFADTDAINQNISISFKWRKNLSHIHCLYLGRNWSMFLLPLQQLKIGKCVKSISHSFAALHNFFFMHLLFLPEFNKIYIQIDLFFLMKTQSDTMQRSLVHLL